MDEVNETCDWMLESQPNLSEQQCYPACIAHVEMALMQKNLEELKKGNKLFDHSQTLDDPCLNRPLAIKEALVVEAYAETTVLLLKAIQNVPNNTIRDGWLLPALFSMHQYLELTIKDSIRYFKLSSGENNFWKIPYPDIHNLQKLWNQLKPLIPEQDDKVFNTIFTLLQDLDRVSDSSMAFRYPFNIDNSGNISSYQYKDRQNQILHLVNCEQLLTRFLQLYNFFEGINALAKKS